MKKIKSAFRFLCCCLPFYLLSVIAYYASKLLQDAPKWVENTYSEKWYPAYAQFVSKISGLVPFSLAELLLVLCTLSLIGLLIYFLFFRIRGLFRYLCVALCFVSVLYAQFIFTWQFNYARLPYAQIRNYPSVEANRENLRLLNEELVKNINLLRSRHAQDDKGCYQTEATAKELLKKVPLVYAQSKDIFPELQGDYAAPKPIYLSKPLSYLQITGIYIPHTVEANVNMQEVSYTLPFTACHEAAHQRGFAREDEANYIAFEICIHSKEEDFRYAGYLMAFLYAGNALAKTDAQAYYEIYSSLCDGAQQDIRAYDAHWAQYEGKAAEVEEKINDTYLKANAQADGVQSYDRMIMLLLARMEKTQHLSPFQASF